MSVSGINPSVNSVQSQQQNKSKVIPPVVGTAVGAIAGAGVATIAKHMEVSSDIAETSQYIGKLQNNVSKSKLEISCATTDSAKKFFENQIKEVEAMIQSQKAELATLKQTLKPMKMLKAIAKSPVTYALTLTGLAVGLYINHKNNNAEQPKNEGVNAQA